MALILTNCTNNVQKCILIWLFLLHFSDYIKAKSIGTLEPLSTTFVSFFFPSDAFKFFGFSDDIGFTKVLVWRVNFFLISLKLILSTRKIYAGLQTWNFENQQICLLFGYASLNPNKLHSGLQTWNFENQRICLLFGYVYCIFPGFSISFRLEDCTDLLAGFAGPILLNLVVTFVETKQGIPS